MLGAQEKGGNNSAFPISHLNQCCQTFAKWLLPVCEMLET
jgi:hypothetical protein